MVHVAIALLLFALLPSIAQAEKRNIASWFLSLSPKMGTALRFNRRGGIPGCMSIIDKQRIAAVTRLQ
jgi:hypothetical protein